MDLDRPNESLISNDFDVLFLPYYSIGVGVNYKNKVHLAFSTESLSFIGTIGYTF